MDLTNINDFTSTSLSTSELAILTCKRITYKQNRGFPMNTVHAYQKKIHDPSTLKLR